MPNLKNKKFIKGQGSSPRVLPKRTFKNLRDFKPKESISQWSESALTDSYFLLFLIFWILPLIFSSVYTALNYSLLPKVIPLFYSRAWGENQLSPALYIYLPIAGSLLLGIVNMGLAISIHAKDKVMAYILASTSSLVSVLAAITTINIVNLIK